MYQGGKARIAGRIAALIADHRGSRQTYVEPFLGGASVFARVAPAFERALGTDVQEDLILLWQAAMSGWEPPESLSAEEYARLREDPIPSPLRAFAAYPCSFAGKRFAGYAIDPSSPRNYAKAGAAGIMARASRMRATGAVVAHLDYRSPQVEAWIDLDTVVYCDPPYRGTLAYRGTDEFDHTEFWAIATDWAARGALVLVSEYTAPDGWTCLHEFGRHSSTALDNTRARSVERVYARDGTEAAWPTLF